MNHIESVRQAFVAINRAGETALYRALNEHCGRVDTRINERAELVERIKRCTLHDGTMHVRVWGRDCDCMESCYSIRIPATLAAYNARYAHMEETAEGPFSLYPMTPREARDFEPYTHDLAMEAYENGRGMCVSI